MNEKYYMNKANITELDFKIGSVVYMAQKINLNINSETSEKIDQMLKIYKKYLITNNNNYKEYIETYLIPNIDLFSNSHSSKSFSPKYNSPKSSKYNSPSSRYHTRRTPPKSSTYKDNTSPKYSKYSQSKKSLLKKYKSLYNFPKSELIMSGAGGELERKREKSFNTNSNSLTPPKSLKFTDFLHDDMTEEELEDMYTKLFDKEISNNRNDSKIYTENIISEGKQEIDELEDQRKNLERLQMDILIKQKEFEQEKQKLKEERIKFEQEKLYKELNDMKDTINSLKENINTLKDTNLAILDETKKNSEMLDNIYTISGDISKEVHDIYTKGKLTWKSPISFAMIMAFKLSVLTVKKLVWPVLKFGTFGWWAGPAIYAFKRSTKHIKYVFGLYILIMIGSVAFKVYHNLNPTELGSDPSVYQYAYFMARDLANGQIIIPLTNYYNSYDSLYTLLESTPNEILSFISPGGVNNPGNRIISQGTDIISGGEMADVMLNSTKNLYEGYAPEMFKTKISLIGEAINYLSSTFTRMTNFVSGSWW